MSPLAYSLLHVSGALLLVGATLSALADPTPTRRRRMLAITGVLSLVVLVAGFGLLAKLGYGFPGWVVVKLVAWLGISALVGVGFRRPALRGTLALVVAALAVVAVWAVYAKPF